jgi:hypothetical protein
MRRLLVEPALAGRADHGEADVAVGPWAVAGRR